MRTFITVPMLLLLTNYCYSIAYKVVYLHSFGYMGIEYRNAPFAVLAISSLFGFIHYYQISKVKSVQIKLFLSILFLFSVVSIPITSWIITNWDVFRWLKINILYSFLIIVFISGTRIKIPILGLKKSLHKITLNIYPLLIALIILVLVLSLNIKLDLNFSTIYDRRLSARESTPLIFKYLISNIIAVIIPISAFISLKEKRFDIGLVTLLLMIFIFSYEGSKAVFFKPLAVLLVVYGFKFIRIKNITELFLKIYALISLGLSFLIYGINNDFLNLILHRSFFLPSKLIVWYLESFDSGMDIGGKKSPAFFIGAKYLGSSEINANSNFIVSGLLNNGFVLTCFITIFASIFIAYILKRGMGSLGLVAAVLLSLTLAESSFLTSLGNHGLILLIIYSEIFKLRYNETMY